MKYFLVKFEWYVLHCEMPLSGSSVEVRQAVPKGEKVKEVKSKGVKISEVKNSVVGVEQVISKSL